MTDFNPIAEAKQIIAMRKAKLDMRVGNVGMDALIDYIDALREALHDTQPYVDKIADEWDDQTADVLAHTIRHLLDD